jgi:hypothetical protein
LKNELGAKMIQQACSLFPQLKDKIDATIVGK